MTSILCAFCYYEVKLISGGLNFLLFSFKNSTVWFFIAFFFRGFFIVWYIIFKTMRKKAFSKFLCYNKIVINSFCYDTGLLSFGYQDTRFSQKRVQNLTFARNFIPSIPAIICLFKINNRNTRKRFEICSKLTIKIPERCQWHMRHISPSRPVMHFRKMF